MSTSSHERTANAFDQQAKDALQDSVLTQALRNATDKFAERRTAAIAAVPDWQALREQARQVKDATVAGLADYIEQFADNAERAGATVHWARDGKEAFAIITKIAEANQATRLVKSKSMATEEIHLNKALAERAREPVETDLGEWIIQLAGETPSHIIVPAIHMTRDAIGELLVDKLGIPPSNDPKTLCAHARERLRHNFANADLSISGVNFGVAETGSILILENEGNVRITTTMPKVHVAVMGIERVIPRFLDLEVFLRLLPRSGTGQHLTTYQSILTGTDSHLQDGYGQGPEQLHIVLLDNGRAKIAIDEKMRETLACIRCGACLNACPVYQTIGGHAYGSVYPGPIGAILTPQLAGLHQATPLPFASSLFGACNDVCPVKIDIPSLLLELRQRAVEGSKTEPAAKRSFIEGITWRMWSWFMRGAKRYRFAMFLGRLSQRVPFLQQLLPPMAAWHATRELPRLARRSFRDTYQGGKQ